MPVTQPASPVITVVGGGFAGTALVLQLRKQPALAGAEIHLIEPRDVPGPGLAYTARRPEYLLNVRPGGLSLYPDAPAHFANWLQTQPESATGVPEFASRATYGRYLREELAAVLTTAPPNLQWHRSTAVTAPLLPSGQRNMVLADGTQLRSDYVVLALGNFPPPPPAGPDHRYLHHPGYHADPWATGNLRRIGPDDSVLLIGSGLTAVDVLLALHHDDHRAPVTVVARHGRWPSAHGPVVAPYPNFYPELAAETTVAGMLAIFKRHLRAAAAQGIDWRPVLDALRPDLGRIWAAWPLVEQRRFLRHLASVWAVARHRSPPQNAAALADLTANGLVQLRAGSVREILPDGDLLRVRIGPRNEVNDWHTAQHVVCCAGPLLDYGRITDPLVMSLRDKGHLAADPLGLGMQTDPHGALRGADGRVSTTLFTLGPSRRPAYFESTAVPEIRQQAADLAQELARRVAGQ
ncbi:FAD/NAD(P)-binding protein [Hymenobacter properus]|uniref:FAD/NAD(P)-binding protein n=1 Tax=Hymenobacter properus TaxID=2791026 RepID=A0A931BH30_9BACT|nr:FAD/NAD(P)-binding protein [Hymenobacter properus]MBF9142341.1 FAD/NAD(P)-binding protein [Hymenobacter properus]MBR7721148.1 FAD/NAD(P)-binding protein [Microvirga sp. SRT04]